jgi:hypothetical protein
MSAVDDVDELIEQFHLEQGEFVKGIPSLARGSSPARRRDAQQPLVSSRTCVG